MKEARMVAVLIFLVGSWAYADLEGRTTINLSGVWEFEQTENAFPPNRFSRKIPVPGLIHLAEPKIEQFDVLLTKDYEPRYSWYRKRIDLPDELKTRHGVLTVLKSKYVTQVFINGIDVGRSISCYTPIEFPVTDALRFGQENEVLIRVGDRAWLPSEAAGSTDKEKIAYLPGIWDEIFLSFTGRFRVHRALVLPSLTEKKVTIKILVRSFYPPQSRYGARMEDPCQIEVTIGESETGKQAALPVQRTVPVKRDNLTEFTIDIPIDDAHPWSPSDPFLYTGEIRLSDHGELSDRVEVRFGMRDFGRQGKHFTLNGKKFILRGTNITLHRFFEDPECEDLPWEREWVRKLLAEIPKKLNWNAMRICVGIAPKFWYDIADECGLLLQNEWLYWQSHGWDDQIRREYTDWVWADGNHPSIVIWDAINENWNSFIGNVLIPDLKKLDPTRIWDAGYMTAQHMVLDEMDEPHPYRVYGMRSQFEEYYTKNPYPLGDLDDRPERLRMHIDSSAAQLANEYGWVWLWRDGRAAKLTEKLFAFYVGENASAKDRRELQAYWLQLQTEWLRAERSLAGVLSFCYLTNNYGFTGDWFIGSIRKLQPGPTLTWFVHCFAPAAVFIDLVDERYTKHLPPHRPGSDLAFNLVGVNDYDKTVGGSMTVRLLDSSGRDVYRSSLDISIPAHGKSYFPVYVRLPEKTGGYLLIAEYLPDRPQNPSPVLSRRYVKVGEADRYRYFEYPIKSLGAL